MNRPLPHRLLRLFVALATFAGFAGSAVSAHAKTPAIVKGLSVTTLTGGLDGGHRRPPAGSGGRVRPDTTPGIGFAGGTQYYPTTWEYYALLDAQTHWNSQPNNGYCASLGETMYYEEYPMGPGGADPSWTVNTLGDTYLGLNGGTACLSIINPLYDGDTKYLMPWADYCETVVHEIGHQMLGPTYFAASNPTDPAHSADPTNVMYAYDNVPTNEPTECKTTHPSGSLAGGV